MTREDVARVAEVSLSTVVRIEGGEGGRKRSTLMAIGRAIGLPGQAALALAEWVAGEIKRSEFESRLSAIPLREPGVSPESFALTDEGGVPILGEVTAGGMVESLVFDNGDEPARVPLMFPGKTRVYALRIRGDSMAPEYRPGEVLIVQDATRDALEDGDDAVIQFDGGADGTSTFKRVIFLGDGKVKLMPLNGAYRAIECSLESIVRIGKLVGIYRHPRNRTNGAK